MTAQSVGWRSLRYRCNFTATSGVPRCAGPMVGPVRPPRSSGRCTRVRRTLRVRADSALDVPPALERPAKGELVGVLEVAADRQAARDAGDPHAEGLD